MLDRDGFRPNVGIVLLNQQNQVFWGKRVRTHSWQFPQGGIDRGENPEQAMFRELHEEVGLQPEQVRVVARTRNWLRYEVPDRFIRRESRGFYKGQKQIWYLLQLLGNDWDLNLRATEKPEFDAWRWNDYWVPLEVVVEFKRDVYEMALTELSRYLPRREPRAGARYLRGTVGHDVPPPIDLEHVQHLRAAHDAKYQDRDRKMNAERGNSLLLNGRVLDLPPGASYDPDPQQHKASDFDQLLGDLSTHAPKTVNP